MEKIRLLEIKIENIVAVESGKILFPESAQVDKNPDSIEDYRGSIIGVYGQNGSGKTTVPFAMNALVSFVARGWIAQSPNKAPIHTFAHLLTKGKNTGSIAIRCLYHGEKNLILYYSLSIVYEQQFGPKVSEESIKVDYFDEETGTYKSYLPLLKARNVDDELEELRYDGVAHRKGLHNSFRFDFTLESTGQLVGVKYANARIVQSFLFSKEYIASLKSSNNDKRQAMASVLEKLKRQLVQNVFFYGPRDDAFQTLGIGSIVGGAKVRDETGFHDYRGTFPFNQDLIMPKRILGTYESMTKQVNTLLSAAVPGFQIKLYKSSAGKDTSGQDLVQIQWRRVVGKGEIPIACESSGIQKLILLASVLALTTGNSSVWLFVDEFDSGVFEQLLSQLVQAFLEIGKGQVLFTAHNLRGLEVLPANHIVFTTANPGCRFLSFKGIKASNNLRSQYMRALKLGGQSESLANKTGISDIERALMTAYRDYEGNKEATNE